MKKTRDVNDQSKKKLITNYFKVSHYIKIKDSVAINILNVQQKNKVIIEPNFEKLQETGLQPDVNEFS